MSLPSKCLASSNTLALFRHLITALPSPSSKLFFHMLVRHDLSTHPLGLTMLWPTLTLPVYQVAGPVLTVKSRPCFPGAYLSMFCRKVSKLFLELSAFPLTTRPKRKKWNELTQFTLDKSLQCVSYQLTNLWLIINWGFNNLFRQSFQELKLGRLVKFLGFPCKAGTKCVPVIPLLSLLVPSYSKAIANSSEMALDGSLSLAD